MDQPITLNSLAYRVGLPADWLKREAEAGRLPCLRVGRRMLFNLPAVRQALTDLAAHSRIAPTAVIMSRLESIPADTEEAARHRRELDRRIGESDEQIGDRKAAEILELPRDVMRSIASRGIIRPIRELGGEFRFSRREIERWKAWTDREAGHA